MSDKRVRLKLEIFTISQDEKLYSREVAKEEVLNITLDAMEAHKLLEILDVSMRPVVTIQEKQP